MFFLEQEGLLKLVDEVNLWKEKRTDERLFLPSITNTIQYANRYFLEGASFIMTKTSGTGPGKPLIGARFATLFRYFFLITMTIN